MDRIWTYIAVMSLVSFFIRVIPLTLIRKQINNRFIKAFLFYVPYVTLAVMTFPSIIHATRSPLSGTAALLAGIVLAWYGASLFKVSALCCLMVFVAEIML